MDRFNYLYPKETLEQLKTGGCKRELIKRDMWEFIFLCSPSTCHFWINRLPHILQYICQKTKWAALISETMNSGISLLSDAVSERKGRNFIDQPWWLPAGSLKSREHKFVLEQLEHATMWEHRRMQTATRRSCCSPLAVPTSQLREPAFLRPLIHRARVQ